MTAPVQAADHVMIWGVEPHDLICDATDCLLTWNSPSNLFREIYIWARRLLQGSVQDPQAIPVAATFGQQYWPVVGGGSGHYLVAWTENVYRDQGTYAQRLERQTITQPVSQPASPRPMLPPQGSRPTWVRRTASPARWCYWRGGFFNLQELCSLSKLGQVLRSRGSRWQTDSGFSHKTARM